MLRPVRRLVTRQRPAGGGGWFAPGDSAQELVAWNPRNGLPSCWWCAGNEVGDVGFRTPGIADLDALTRTYRPEVACALLAHHGAAVNGEQQIADGQPA